jgi:alanine racemase
VSFYLEVDKTKFQSHLLGVKKDVENLVPVIKGTGYGFGLNYLAQEAFNLGVDTVAVGTVFEAQKVSKDFSGKILVLEPYNSFDLATNDIWKTFDKRYVRTVSSLNSNFDFNNPFVIEGRVSTNRFGLSKNEIKKIDLKNDFIEGLALHLAINQSENKKLREILEWLETWQEVSSNKNIWLSHISKSLLYKLKELKPEFKFNVRIGTELWLGDKSFIWAKGVVLGIIEGVERAGYSQKKLARGNKIVVVSGGTANGVGLNSDVTIKKSLDRLRVFLTGLLGSFGKYQSAFLFRGKKTYLFEPTHMNVSLIKVSANQNVVVGDVLEARVRYSTCNFDFIK